VIEVSLLVHWFPVVCCTCRNILKSDVKMPSKAETQSVLYWPTCECNVEIAERLCIMSAIGTIHLVILHIVIIDFIKAT